MTSTVQSETRDIQYRKARLWQIIFISFNALNGMSVYFLIGLSSYSASIGYGVATLVVGGLLTFSRLFDAFTDPILAILYDRINTPFGKIRPLLLAGWVLESLGLLGLFHFFSSKGFGIPVFIACNMLFVIGYTLVNMTAQTIPSLITNDPKQRPMVGVWSTIFNYATPMAINIIVYTKILPAFGGEFNQQFLSVTTFFCVAISFIGVIVECIGVAAYDRPENFKGIGKKEPLRIRDMAEVLIHNKPLQSYILSASSDKIAQQAASASVVGTMLSGILIGNMGLSSILGTLGMLPSILFAFYGARFAGKHGNKESIVIWTRNAIYANLVTILFFFILRMSVGTTSIAVMGVSMVLYVLLNFIGNGFTMCITTANSAFMADIIDYELDRSGRYIPAVVTGTYSFIDKVVSSFSAAIATAMVALIGYTSVMPQPTDPATDGVFWMTMFLRYGLAILGWTCTLFAMRGCTLTKEAVKGVQGRISQKKEELKAKM